MKNVGAGIEGPRRRHRYNADNRVQGSAVIGINDVLKSAFIVTTYSESLLTQAQADEVIHIP